MKARAVSTRSRQSESSECFLSDGVPHAPSMQCAVEHDGTGAVSVSLLQTKTRPHEGVIDCRQVAWET